MNFDHRELLFMEEKNYSSWSLEETGEFLAYKVREFDTDTDIACEIRRKKVFIVHLSCLVLLVPFSTCNLRIT